MRSGGGRARAERQATGGELAKWDLCRWAARVGTRIGTGVKCSIAAAACDLSGENSSVYRFLAAINYVLFTQEGYRGDEENLFEGMLR